MATAEEGQHVVLAQTVELDVLHDDHTVGLLREDGSVDQLHRVCTRAGGEKSQRGSDALRRLHQTFALRVLANFDEYLVDQALDLLGVHMHGRMSSLGVGRDALATLSHEPKHTLSGVNFPSARHGLLRLARVATPLQCAHPA